MSYQRFTYSPTTEQMLRQNMWSRYQPIYDDTFADLLAKLDLIEFHPKKKS